MNNRRNIYLPIIFSALLIAGIFIGINLERGKPSGHILSRAKETKLNTVLNFINSEYVDSVDAGELEEAAIPVMLEKLDPHSIYIPAKDVLAVNEPLEGNFDGIGVSFNMPNDTVIIISVIPGGPSEKVGIMAGDRITEVDGKKIAGVKMDSDDVVKKLKGPRGTKVVVGIQRKSVDELIEFTITRDKIPLYSVDASYMVNDSTGYIKFSKFARTTYQEFMEALNKLQDEGMTGLVLDLRGNSGGYLDQANNIANQFLEEGQLIVYTQGRSHKRQNTLANGRGKFKKGALVVLMDEFSASASEIIAGAVQDNDRGTIMGRRSFGKGLVQEPLFLQDGSMIRLTTARYYTPTGRCIQKSYENGNEDYYKDLEDRFIKGEFMESDSIEFADSLRYTTPGGKVVYGGGGIMPDIFVPVDTSGISEYFLQLRARGLMYRFAFEYTDRNREALLGYNSAAEIEEYLDSQDVMGQLIGFAKKNGITKDDSGLAISGDIIHTQVNAYIARNVIDNKGFYPIWNRIDNTITTAVNHMAAK